MDIDSSGLQIKKLSDENLLLTESFDCGNDDLNEFLNDDALKHQKEKIAVTYLCFYESEFVGYFSWLTDAIDIKGKDKRVFKKIGMNYRTYPAIKLGRLAIDKKYAKSGVGSYLIDRMLKGVTFFSEYLGCRFATVDAYADAKEFYKKLGFKIRSEREHTVFMYIDIKSLLKSLR